jgi:predicted molibdopterin-dependent oxidoreductase YjgC
VEVTWDVALRAAADLLRETTADKVGVLTSTHATNEALYLVGALFRETLGVRHTGLLNTTAPLLLEPQGTLGDLSDTDLILVVGADPVVEQPVVSFLIKRAADRGVPLIVIGQGTDGLAPFASRVFGESELTAAVELSGRVQQPLVVYGSDLTVEGATALQKLDRARFVALEPGANTRAAVAFGLNRMFDGAGAETVFVLEGEEPSDGHDPVSALDPGCSVIVQACYQSPLVERADVVLPMATWQERSGTVTNLEGRVLDAHQAIEPAGEAKQDWESLTLLAEKLGLAGTSGIAELTALAKQELAR